MKTHVETYFKREGLPYEVLYLTESTATVPLAAAALGVKPERIAKSLTYRLKERDIMVVACGTARIDNRKFKETFGCKAKMMTPEEALALTGYAVGGVCPFDLPEGIRVYLDESLRRFDAVYPAAGASNACTKISPTQLQQLTNALWVDVSKAEEEEAL